MRQEDDPTEDAQLKWVNQDDLRDTLGRDRGEWTTLYQSGSSTSEDAGRYSALVPASRRMSAMKKPSWDLLAQSYTPGFSTHYEDGEEIVEYYRISDDDGFEPVVRIREWYGVRSQYVELTEDFRLFHNLWTNGDGNYFAFDDAGSDVLVAELTHNLVRVKTRYLRQYQAARQLDLLLYFETTRRFSSTPDPHVVREEEIESPDTRAVLIVDENFSRFLGKRLVEAPPVEQSGVWPYEKTQNYPEFVYDVDDDGEPLSYSCDPEKLGNYFGKNPNAPQYITPVYFTRSVLSKYYDRPEMYSVDDGHLTCAGLWTLRMDNDGSDHVMVYLGDLGRDLPEVERLHWAAHCTAERGQMSETAFRRGFLAEFADSTAVDLVFRQQYSEFARRFEAAWGWSLFRAPNTEDSHLLNTIRIPASDSAPEFERQILNITKLLADFINEKALKAQIVGPLPENAKGITKLEFWLRQQNYSEAERDVKFLRQLQDLRSKGAAHGKGSSYRDSLIDAAGTTDQKRAIVVLLERANLLLQGFSAELLGGKPGTDSSSTAGRQTG